MKKFWGLLLSALLSLTLAPLTSAHAASDPHGPRLIYGAPVRHTLTSCATNPGNAIACIESVTMTSSSGATPVSGRITSTQIPTDERYANSERPITAPESSTLPATINIPVLSIYTPEGCHGIGTIQTLQIRIGNTWTDLKKEPASSTFTASNCPTNMRYAGFDFSEAEGTALLASDNVKNSAAYGDLSALNKASANKIEVSSANLRFRIADPNGAWEWFSTEKLLLSWSQVGTPQVIEVTLPQANRGYYEEWTFPKNGKADSTNNIAVIAEFQPYKATWCWSETICNDRREEFLLAIRPTTTPGLWEESQAASFTITMRAAKSFQFGEVSGSAQRVVVKYGKDLPPVNGQATREIIATFSPIATARGGTPTEMAVKATMITYDANIWIYGQNNGIVDGLGVCGKIGGVQVVSNAMHSLDPSWNAETESIEVRLSTPHLRPDGSVNVGYLEIRMPREAAMCMWKVDLDGNLKASVNITYDDGSSPSVATVVGQRIGNDYLIVSSGFHYSSPKLAIKLSNSASTDQTPTAPEATPAVAPAATALAPAIATPAKTPAKTVAKTKTVCVKGKTIKNIAPSAKCPVGYAKKVVKA